jgi:hypothetical protein
VDIRALDPRENVPEHDIDATIASLESQVDHLCSLLDNFRSDFQQKLQEFRDSIRDLPERVGVDYSPRQRAHLLNMYSRSIAESGELALHKLQHDLAHLVSLEGYALPYEEYCSTASSFVSCRDAQDSTDAVSDERPEGPRKLHPFTSLLRAAISPTLARPTPHHDPNSSAIEVTFDNDDDNGTTPNRPAQQPAPARSERVALRPHREVIIDWDRFCGDCPARTETSYCKGCSGWRRGFEDPTWDGRDSRESIGVSAKDEDIAW